MEEQKEYYAFISYKREDEKWAKWLQDKLEHYKFPTNLNGRTDLPKKIRPIFRDVTDLNPGLLAEEIENALRNSEWLIVICSPRSAKSPWVCKEAQTFIDLGRADHIIPFVIEGNPFSNDTATECYPEALLNLTGSKELLAANINEMGRDAAAIKVVSRMFNLRFDALWQRYEREQRRKRWMWIGGSILFALLGLGIGAYFVKQNRTIKNQNAQLENAANRLREDSLTLANLVSKIQEASDQLVRKNDSLVLQNELIVKQKYDLNQTNSSLEVANLSLKQERDNLEKANWEIKKKQARAIAGIANSLIEKGDYYTARLLALEILPTDSSDSGKPYIPEAEAVLRTANEFDNGMIQFGSVFPHEAALSHDGGKIVIQDGGKLKIIDTYDGRTIDETYDDTAYLVEQLFWSPDNKTFAQVCCKWEKGKVIDNCIKVWDTSPLSFRIYPLAFTDKSINSSTFSPDGKNILYTMNNTVYNINLKSSQRKMLFSGHSDKINQISFSHYASRKFNRHYQIVSASSDKTVRMWDAETGELLITLSGHVNSVKYAFFTKDDKRIISADDKNIIIWDAETGDSLFSILTNDKITSLSLGGNNRCYVCMSEGTVASYSIRTGEATETVNDRYYYSWIYNESGKGMSISSDGIIRFYSGRNYSDFPYIGKIHKSMVHDVSFSPDGSKIISGSEDSTIIIWNTSACHLNTIVGHTGPVTSARFSPNGETIVSASRDSTIRIWDANLLGLIKTISFSSAMTSISFSSDGKLLTTAAENGQIYIYNTQTWERIKQIGTNAKGIYSAVLSSDKKSILALSLDDQKVGLWDIENEFCIDSITMRNDLRRIAWSPDEKYLAIQTVDSILVWNIQSKSIENRWRAPGLNIAFSPNGRWIVNSDLSSSLFLWDAHSGTLVKSLKGHSGFMGGISFSTDGGKIVADYSAPYGKSGEGIEVWEIEPLDSIIKKTRKRFEKRKLSVGERKQYYME